MALCTSYKHLCQDREVLKWSNTVRHPPRNRVFLYLLLVGILFLLATPSILAAAFLVTSHLPNEVFSHLMGYWLPGVTFSTYHAHGSIQDVAWEGLKGGEHCLRYATREYTAKLVGQSDGQDMMKLCKDVPVQIHGRTLFTDFCQDLGFGRGVWGFWVVDFEEPDCETTWGKFIDLGCNASLCNESPVRCFESHLEHLQAGSNWQIMCTTTPADIAGHHFSTPVNCYNSANTGTYGVWDIVDSSCGEII
ncbi:hypothetical protein CPB84DRAFT_559307 [Gymnopilus junonius]|uniref:Uncharacterized protein n=1 Tax=Gymnopilus junonius TaxID=109634 RepID=A0A9P5TFL6_GYMJU|nr:hypothetical protein CPB84DRAFT_559307 [Gymnopilus junonius]